MDKQAGFSLMEVMISLIILGLIGGLGLSAATRYMDSNRLQKTRDHQDKLLSLLASQVISQGVLPLPADPSAQGENRGYAHKPFGRLPYAIGVVPYKTLGVSQSLTLDGYGRPFTYALHTGLAQENQSLRGKTDLTKYLSVQSTPLRILDARTQPLTKTIEVVAVVLVSHGKLGYGAFDGRGVRIRNASQKGLSEEINGDDTGVFVDRPLSENPRDYHDDVVVWATRDTILSIHGKAPHLLEVNKR